MNRSFVSDCRELSLVGGKRATVDGTFLKASANRGRVHTKDSLSRGFACLDKLIESHYRAMDEADATELEGTDPVDPDLVRKMEELLARRAAKKALQDRLEKSGDTQVSEVDPEARLLRKSGKSVVGYNGQIAVDDKAKLIVATDVVQDGNDSQQREPMMTQTSEAVGNEGLVGLADAGYANGDQLKGCEDKGMKMYVPLPDKAICKGKDGRIGTEDFRYDKATDSYVCPAGKRLLPGGQTHLRRGKKYLVYRSDAKGCGFCPLAARCFPPTSSSRRVTRWEHADVMDRHRERMAEDNGEVMGLRGSLVEHPFGCPEGLGGCPPFSDAGIGQVPW